MSSSELNPVAAVSFKLALRAPVKRIQSSDGIRHRLHSDAMPTREVTGDGHSGVVYFTSGNRFDPRRVQVSLGKALGCDPRHVEVHPT